MSMPMSALGSLLLCGRNHKALSQSVSGTTSALPWMLLLPGSWQTSWSLQT